MDWIDEKYFFWNFKSKAKVMGEVKVKWYIEHDVLSHELKHLKKIWIVDFI